MLLRAETVDALQEVSGLLHDANVESDAPSHDPQEQTVTVEFAQESFALPDLPQKELVRKQVIGREYRVPFLRGRLIVRDVQSMTYDPEWGFYGSIYGVKFNESKRQVTVFAGMEPLRIRVARLCVEAELTSEVLYLMRRRSGLLGTLDTRWR